MTGSRNRRRSPSRAGRRPGGSGIAGTLRQRYHGRFGPAPTPERWVFVVGCYNSGTTLLHDLLARHDEIASLPTEGQFLTDQLPMPSESGLPRLWAIEPERFRLTEADVTDIDVARIKRQWGARFDHPDRPVLVERSPTDAARTRWLQHHFAPATFVGIIRDGRAVAEGIRRRAGHPIELAAQQWATSNRIMLQDFESLDDGVIIRYEDLVERPEETISAVLDRLGLHRLPAVTGSQPVTVHGRTAPIRNMNRCSFDALSPADRDAIRDVAGDLLDDLGYS